MSKRCRNSIHDSHMSGGDGAGPPGVVRFEARTPLLFILTASGHAATRSRRSATEKMQFSSARAAQSDPENMNCPAGFSIGGLEHQLPRGRAGLKQHYCRHIMVTIS